ncbi:hypothetical protein M8C21_007236 [Ambrosia artemisiifolia]|uniref:GATA-type domain-containing protein n=1 Tax=Ambrosia artemisiifolia TaxID=4212 RepID=A0AAD5C8U1_AMBAR|nr:hypothetical protein M8C21_007236 [Ambrosia artemisiifolia]
MTPIFFNSSSNNYTSYPTDHYEDHLQTYQFLTPISQPSSSSSSKSLTTHMFLNSNDENGILKRDLNESPQYEHEGDQFGSQAYNNHGIENNNMNGSNDLSTCNKSSNLHQVKWMSSKMRVMLKMKKTNHHHPMNPNTYSSTSTQVTKLEEHNSPMEETDNSSNSTSSNNNIPIRVCSDCNTTKTPLWRSGPRGPKSLCNACGIRQRKARRAAAAAAAAENCDRCVYNDQLVMAPLKVTKTLNKDLKKPSKGHVTKYKKRQYSKQITITPPSSSSSPSLSPSSSPPSSSLARKNGVEEFLDSLSKNLSTFYHVLPQDEREAAILLMAISCGYAHETEKSI